MKLTLKFNLIVVIRGKNYRASELHPGWLMVEVVHDEANTEYVPTLEASCEQVFA